MTTAEACVLAVGAIREVRNARQQALAYRRLAQQALHYSHGLHVELDRLRERYERLLGEHRDLSRHMRGAA